MDVKTMDQTYVAGTYARFDVQITSGAGDLFFDGNGKEYIDLGSGIAVNIFGTGDEEWKRAVKAQLDAFQHTSNLYYTAPCANLAKMLCERTGLKRVFFGNSGAEANECAIKVARKYAEDKGRFGENIITLKNSFHGRTLATLAATGQDVFHEHFLPLPGGFLYADANDIAGLENLVSQNKCCAIFMEMVQGEGGVNALDGDFVRAAEKLCREHDMLLMIDEVQTGNGRTGKLYAYEHFGVRPDVVTTAKGLGGGLPIGACMMGEKCAGTLTAGTHGSTFGGNPVSCAGAVSILSRIDDELLCEVAKKGAYLKERLEGADGVLSVTGLGLMLGVKTRGDASDVLALMRKNGVLALKAKDKVRLLPPLNITWEHLEKAAEVMRKACAAL